MSIQGDFTLLSPASLLQIVCQEQRSVVISAWRGCSAVCVHLSEGFVVAARCGDVEGDEAVYQFMAWDSGRFEVVPLPEPSEDGMMAHWEELVLEAARRRDELELALAPLPPAPPWQQLGALLQSCPALAGVALVGHDGRLLGSIGLDKQVMLHAAALATGLAGVGSTLDAATPQGASKPSVALYIHRGRKLLLADRGNGMWVLAVPAPTANIGDASAQLMAQLVVVQ